MPKSGLQHLLLVGVLGAIVVSCGGVAPVLTTAPTMAPPPTQLPSQIVAESPSATYWPTKGWRTSTPEQQGMDSEMLAQVFQLVEDEGLHVRSLLVVRNGYLVVEAYFYPFQEGMDHWLASCTKSVTSALVGIALAEGYIGSVDQPVLGLFPDRTFADQSPRKEALTLEHLLTMTSGLDWTEDRTGDSAAEMEQSDDWVQFVLDRPMVHDPGSVFYYNSGVSHVLSAIVQEVTGMTTTSFAQAYLFDQLGISGVRWDLDPHGTAIGGWGLLLEPRDMARFGYLYLQEGLWDGQQVVPADWIASSVKEHVQDTGQDSGYGYQWWIPASGGFAALGLGAGGQLIYVLPDLEMVVVSTGALGPQEAATLSQLLGTSIVPAVQSSKPLPENPKGLAALTSWIEEVGGRPSPEPVLPLPDMARRISGRTYRLENSDLQSFSLMFEGSEALLALTKQGVSQVFPVGLDNVFRVSQVDQPGPWLGAYAFRGIWRDEEVFVIDLHFLDRWPLRAELTLDFDEEGVTLHEHYPLRGRTEEIRGTPLN